MLSEVHSGYAPDGRALISTSVLGAPGAAEEAAVRAALAEAYDTDTDAWESVHRCTVRDALPAMPPPLPLTRTTRFGPGRYVCGDHRATGSLQGALASGARAARRSWPTSAADDQGRDVNAEHDKERRHFRVTHCHERSSGRWIRSSATGSRSRTPVRGPGR